MTVKEALKEVEGILEENFQHGSTSHNWLDNTRVQAIRIVMRAAAENCPSCSRKQEGPWKPAKYGN